MRTEAISYRNLVSRWASFGQHHEASSDVLPIGSYIGQCRMHEIIESTKRAMALLMDQDQAYSRAGIQFFAALFHAPSFRLF